MAVGTLGVAGSDADDGADADADGNAELLDGGDSDEMSGATRLLSADAEDEDSALDGSLAAEESCKGSDALAGSLAAEETGSCADDALALTTGSDEDEEALLGAAGA